MSQNVSTAISSFPSNGNSVTAQSSVASLNTNNNKEKDNSQNGQNSKNNLAKKKKSNAGVTLVANPSVPTNSKVYFWSSECKYSVIIDRVKELDWKLVDSERYESRVNLIWVDVSTIHEHFRTIQPWQMINHFPGMPNIARKNRMGQNLNKMLKLFPKEYSFYPKTWILPGEMVDFRQQFDSNGNSIGNKIYIIKPDAGCQGRGIFLTRTFDNVPTQENVVAQVYIKKPLLLDGYKFDLRLYCFISSVRPLRMYLFQDGLVRMCTEEYVKPTKQNISNVCMHLTNYAVNKHNENFQQPSAASSEESQEGDSKRSLLWFMNFIRKEHGDSKADWLWQRMGVLCTRTILAIMPILSREYEQHFKSFNSVPVDISKIPAYGSSYAASGGGNAADGATSEAAETKGNEAVDSKDESDNDGSKTPRMPTMRGSRCFEILGFDVMIDANLKPWIIEVNHLPSFGTDSLLDKDIKERLMEQVFDVLPVLPDDQQAYIAHHKAESEKRLIQSRKQVNAETSTAKNAKSMQPSKPGEAAKPKPNGGIAISAAGKGNDANGAVKRDKPANPSGRDNNPNGTMDKSIPNSSGPSRSVSANPQAKHDHQASDDGGGGNSFKNYAEDGDDIIYEECTPARLQEIKNTLIQIYQKYSPEKTSKIDRLLAKYVGHEEEFLRFVYMKYDVKPELRGRPNNSGASSARNASSNAQSAAGEVSNDDQGSVNGLRQHEQEHGHESNGEEGESDHNQGDQDQDEGNESNDHEEDYDNSSVLNDSNGDYSNLRADGGDRGGAQNAGNGSNPKPPMGGNNGRDRSNPPKMRFSRSVSPPRSTTPHNNRRAPASWKVATAEEDSAFRAEILALHVPDENEEWMQYELSKLSQFTRIFPAGDPRMKNKGGSNEDIDREEDNDNDDNEDGEEEKDKSKDKDKDKTFAKSCPYDEILYQVFMQDRRQTMRLHCPLPNRAIEKDNASGSSLPLIDSSSNTSRTSSSTMSSSGKGVVGWKAPPKPVRKEVVRQPTQTQADAAKRLSQGLSVAASSQRDAAIRHRNTGISNNFFHYNSSHFSSYPPNGIILDPQEYPPQMFMNNANVGLQMNAGDNISVGSYNDLPPDGLPSTKSAKLIEECRINRMRLEAVRQANNAAVLRQQVFHFDPNYYPYFGAGGAAGDSNTILNNQSAQSIGALGGGGLAAGGGGQVNAGLLSGLGTNPEGQHPMQGKNVGGNGMLAPQSNGFNGPTVGAASSSTFTGGGSSKLRGVGGVGVGVGGGGIKPGHTVVPMVHGNGNGNGNGNVSVGTGEHSQEELLRQLFPSWF